MYKLLLLVVLHSYFIIPENLTKVFGEHLRTQVEDRLNFFATGDIPKKNEEVMKEALADHNAQVENVKEADETVNGQLR